MYVHVYMYACIYIYTCVHACTCMHVCTCVHACACACTSACLYPFWFRNRRINGNKAIDDTMINIESSLGVTCLQSLRFLCL